MYTNNYSNSVSTNSLYKVYSWMMVGLGITAITSALLYASGIFMLIIQIPMIFIIVVHRTNFVNDFNGTSIIT